MAIINLLTEAQNTNNSTQDQLTFPQSILHSARFWPKLKHFSLLSQGWQPDFPIRDVKKVFTCPLLCSNNIIINIILAEVRGVPPASPETSALPTSDSSIWQVWLRWESNLFILRLILNPSVTSKPHCELHSPKMTLASGKNWKMWCKDKGYLLTLVMANIS